jgi:hypothetical protein
MNIGCGSGFKLLFVLMLSLTCGVSSGFGQTAKEIIQQVIKAIGGEDQVRKINSVVKKGFISIGEDSLQVTVTQLNGKGKKTVMEMSGLKGYEIINKDQGWVYMPFDGHNEEQELDADIHAMRVIELDIQGIFLDCETKGFTATRLDNDFYDDKEYFKIKLSKSADVEFHFLIDPYSKFITQLIEIRKTEGKLMMRQTKYDDYRNVGRVKLPFQEENQYGMIKYNSIKTGMKISDSVFLPD